MRDNVKDFWGRDPNGVAVFVREMRDFMQLSCFENSMRKILDNVAKFGKGKLLFASNGDLASNELEMHEHSLADIHALLPICLP